MCCHACPGYELCRTKKNLKQDDCCPQCPYFSSCMEETLEEDVRVPRSHPARRS